MNEPEGQREYEALIKAFRSGSVTGGDAKTWTYNPAMQVTISAGSGVRVGLRLLADSLVALIRRETVTFEIGDDE